MKNAETVEADNFVVAETEVDDLRRVEQVSEKLRHLYHPTSSDQRVHLSFLRFQVSAFEVVQPRIQLFFSFEVQVLLFVSKTQVPCCEVQILCL